MTWNTDTPPPKRGYPANEKHRVRMYVQEQYAQAFCWNDSVRFKVNLWDVVDALVVEELTPELFDHYRKLLKGVVGEYRRRGWKVSEGLGGVLVQGQPEYYTEFSFK